MTVDFMDSAWNLRNALQTYDVKRSSSAGNVCSPIQTLTDFSHLGLNAELYRAICKMGFRNPSRIQETALPILMENPPTNMMAQSQSGTGKTAAFFFFSLTRENPQDKWPQVLVVLPTLELSEQIDSQCRQMLEFTPGIEVRHAIRGELETLFPWHGMSSTALLHRENFRKARFFQDSRALHSYAPRFPLIRRPISRESVILLE